MRLLKTPLFQLGGVLVAVMITEFSFLHREIKGLHGDIKGLHGDIKGLHGDIKGLRGDIKSAGANLEAILDADRKEAAVDHRQMQATLHEILKAQSRSWL